MSCRLEGKEFPISVNSLIQQTFPEKLHDYIPGTVRISGDQKTSETVPAYKRLTEKPRKSCTVILLGILETSPLLGTLVNSTTEVISDFSYNTWSLLLHRFFFFFYRFYSYFLEVSIRLDSQRSPVAWFPCSIHTLAFLPYHPCYTVATILLNTSRSFLLSMEQNPGPRTLWPLRAAAGLCLN